MPNKFSRPIPTPIPSPTTSSASDALSRLSLRSRELVRPESVHFSHGLMPSQRSRGRVITKRFNKKKKPLEKNKTKKTYTHSLRLFSQTVNSPKRFAQLLTNLCGDAGSCLTFGKYVQPTKKLFHHFASFQHTQPIMKRIGSLSANGFVYEIEYEHHGFRAHTILKCSLPPADPDSMIDGLYYEYIVGQFFINDCAKRFPCFLETYGAYNLDHTVVAHMSELKTFPVAVLQQNIQPYPPIVFSTTTAYVLLPSIQYMYLDTARFCFRFVKTTFPKTMPGSHVLLQRIAPTLIPSICPPVYLGQNLYSL